MLIGQIEKIVMNGILKRFINRHPHEFVIPIEVGGMKFLKCKYCDMSDPIEEVMTSEYRLLAAINEIKMPNAAHLRIKKGIEERISVANKRLEYYKSFVKPSPWHPTTTLPADGQKIIALIRGTDSIIDMYYGVMPQEQFQNIFSHWRGPIELPE